MQSILSNLINGNLTDAKTKAKRYSFWKILSYMEETGWSTLEAFNTASYLKGRCSFQDYCDRKASPVSWMQGA
jgi:hypothetical protein